MKKIRVLGIGYLPSMFSLLVCIFTPEDKEVIFKIFSSKSRGASAVEKQEEILTEFVDFFKDIQPSIVVIEESPEIKAAQMYSSLHTLLRKEGLVSSKFEEDKIPFISLPTNTLRKFMADRAYVYNCKSVMTNIKEKYGLNLEEQAVKPFMLALFGFMFLTNPDTPPRRILIDKYKRKFYNPSNKQYKEVLLGYKRISDKIEGKFLIK